MQTFTTSLTEQLTPEAGTMNLLSATPGHPSTYRDLDTTAENDQSLRGYDLFSLFTANIIKQDVPFTR